ncbi:MAG: helix-turn-helix domain-containing protein [Chloroflexi bacterium]|nr:helix-turn-helix domain-containing protein [Chloroflexota bacterium]
MPNVQTTPSNDWRETRRLLAWELHQQGWSQTRIAETLGVTQGAVSQWLKRCHEGGGIEALRHHPAPGRKAFLTEEQLTQLPALIACSASAFGFEGDHWTNQRVASVLKQLFGVSYHPGHVSRLLKKHCPDWRIQKLK